MRSIPKYSNSEFGIFGLSIWLCLLGSSPGGVGGELLTISSPPPPTTRGGGTRSPGGGILVVVGSCVEERECKAACGSSASDSRCNHDSGVCVCLNEFGPSRRCRNVKHSEEECTSVCKRKIAQVCYTDFGKFCSCFVRN